MKKENFQLTIEVNASPEEVLRKINQVDRWWAKKVKGKSEKLKDAFMVDFGSTFVDFQITELVPSKKVVWLVTDCNLHWIDDKKEWKNNEITWTLTEKGGKTAINFVHKGMNSESECYESCKPGWTHHIQDSLVKLIENGKGSPE
jgi:hypothetical protein